MVLIVYVLGVAFVIFWYWHIFLHQTEQPTGIDAQTWSEVKPVVRLYRKYLAKVKFLVDTSPTELSTENEIMKVLEISAVLCAIIDLAAFSAQKDDSVRRKYSKAIRLSMFDDYEETKRMSFYFSDRVLFYTKVLSGNQRVIGLFAPGVNLSARGMVITRCAVAFSDCCMGQVYIDNYDDAPLLLVGIPEAMIVFEQFVKPLENLFNKLISKILKL